MPTTTVGANVRAEMARRAISQTELASAIGMQQSGLSLRLRNARDWSAGELLKVARVLGVDVAVFYEGVEPAAASSEAGAA